MGFFYSRRKSIFETRLFRFFKDDVAGILVDNITFYLMCVTQTEFEIVWH